MKTIKVRAKDGTRCPMEGKPKIFITDSVAVDVPATPYYRRLVRPEEGSLIDVEKEQRELAENKKATKVATQKTEKGGK